MRRALLALGLVLTLVAGVSAGQFFNSSECATNGDGSPVIPGRVLCDDFEDGTWATTCNDELLAANNGWLICNGGPRDPVPPATTCGGAGAVGTNCATVSNLTNSSCSNANSGGDAQLGMHGFYPNNATYDELYVRFYRKQSVGYTPCGNQKFISFIKAAYQGGIDLGGALTRDQDTIIMAAGWDCDDNNYFNPQNGTHRQCYLEQNQGNNLTFIPGHWYFIEFYVKNNTYSVRDGLAKVWANDCGTNGLGCTGTPTLRSSYTNIGWRGQGAGTPPSPSPGGAIWGTPTTPLMGSMWFDIWGNPSDIGTINLDQIVASTIGPVGFMGGSPPPGTPTGLRICKGVNCVP